MANASTIPDNPDAPWFEGQQVFELQITKPGEHTSTTLRTGGVSAAWQVSGTTPLSAEVATDDLLFAFQTTDLRAYWLFWKHPRLGTWAGEISECEADYRSGTTELAARDFSALLEARRVHKIYNIDHAAPAGGLFKRTIVDAQRESDGYSWIKDVRAEETSDPIQWQFRGGKVSDAIRSLASRSGEEWWIDSNRVAWWSVRRGRNKVATVQLVEGRHIISHRYSVALGPLVNDLLAVPATEQYATSQAFVIDDDASIKRFGRRQDTLTYTVGVTKSALQPVAKKDLNRLKKLGDTIRFDLVDVDGCFAWFGDGDVVRLLLPSINKRLDVRVMARSYDTESSVLTVSADVES